MSDTLTILPASGKDGSGSTRKKSARAPVEGSASGTMTVRSLVDACDHPGTGLSIPKRGTIFDVDADRGAALVAGGLVESAPEGVKGE
jgi:hypothetical protein